MRNEMTSRERVLTCFKGQAHDRAPVIDPTLVATIESIREHHHHHHQWGTFLHNQYLDPD